MEIPIDLLDASTLRAVIEEFVSRDGTDLSDMSARIELVEAQLRTGKAKLHFDPDSESCHILAKDDDRQKHLMDPQRAGPGDSGSDSLPEFSESTF